MNKWKKEFCGHDGEIINIKGVRESFFPVTNFIIYLINIYIYEVKAVSGIR